MTNVNRWLLLSAICQVMFFSAVTRADSSANKSSIPTSQKQLTEAKWSLDRDMAFVSVLGSRPAQAQLMGFKRAVLYNARGEVVRKFSLRGDSIYCLDQMIQVHQSRGPLFVRMYRK